MEKSGRETHLLQVAEAAGGSATQSARSLRRFLPAVFAFRPAQSMRCPWSKIWRPADLPELAVVICREGDDGRDGLEPVGDSSESQKRGEDDVDLCFHRLISFPECADQDGDVTSE